MSSTTPPPQSGQKQPASSEELQHLLRARTVNLNTPMTGVLAGIVLGLGLFLVTALLLLKGPDEEGRLGEHLSLLGQFFIGYRVSWAGSLIGLGYGFVFGLLAGIAFSRIYNGLVELRNRRSRTHL